LENPAGQTAWLILIYGRLVATDGPVQRCADNMAEGGVSGVINQASSCQSVEAGVAEQKQTPATGTSTGLLCG